MAEHQCATREVCLGDHDRQPDGQRRTREGQRRPGQMADGSVLPRPPDNGYPRDLLSPRQSSTHCWCQAAGGSPLSSGRPHWRSALQFALPEPHLRPVAAAAVCRDGKTLGVRVARLAELLPPTSDAFDGECPGIGIDADADPAKIGGNVVDPLWRDLAQFRYLEVVHPHRFGIALRA